MRRNRNACVNTKAVAIMKEEGIDISHNTSNNIHEYRHIYFDYVITVCNNAKEQCPVFPSKAKQFHHNFPDSAKTKNSEEQVMQEFRQVREMIKKYIQDLSWKICKYLYE